MFLTINSTRINYVKKGKGQPLIFLHGIFLDSCAYNKLYDILGNYFTVYAIDLPMHGKSGDLKGDVSIADYADIVEEFAEKLNIKNPVIFGYSAGGLVAMLFASKNEVKELILGDSAGVIHPGSIFSILFRLIFIMVPVGLLLNPVGLLRISSNGVYNFFRNISNKQFFSLSNDVLKNDFTKEMKKIRCPVTILWAKHDEVIPFRYSKIFLKNIKNARLIEITGNHMWPALRPKEINKLFNS